MTGLVLLAGVGAMLVLIGVALAAAMIAGIHIPATAGHSRSRRVRWRPQHTVAVLAGLASLLLTGWIAVAVGVTGAVLLVPAILTRPGSDAQIARLEALGAWTRRLSDLLVSGAASSLESAVGKSAPIAPAPIAAQVNALVWRMSPRGLGPALLRFARDLGDPISDEVVMTLMLQLRHGGRGLAQVLTALADHVDDQVRMRREVEADRAKPRSNVRTLVLLTLGMSAAMMLFARTFLAPYGTAQGQVALLGVVAVFATALLWLRRMIAQPAGLRLLTDADLQPDTDSDVGNAFVGGGR